MNYRHGPPNQHYGGGGNNQYRPHPRGSPPQHSSHLSQSPPSREFHRPSGGGSGPAIQEPEPQASQHEEEVTEIAPEQPVVPEPVVVEEILEKNNFNPEELNLEGIENTRYE